MEQKIQMLTEKVEDLTSKNEGMSAQEVRELLDTYEELVGILLDEREKNAEEVKKLTESKDTWYSLYSEECGRNNALLKKHQMFAVKVRDICKVITADCIVELGEENRSKSVTDFC